MNYRKNFFPGEFFHIYNRAVGNEKMFFKNENYKYFIRKYHIQFKDIFDTYAYCLMNNHFHLLVKIKEHISGPNVSENLRRFFIGYAQAIN